MAPTVVLVTGANSGIGCAIVDVFAGASVDYHIIMSGRSIEKLNVARQEILARHPQADISILRIDAKDDETIHQAADHVRDVHGRLDILINNAGVGSLDKELREGFQLCLETNFIGPAMICDAFRPLLYSSENAYSIFVETGARSLVRNGLELTSALAKVKAASKAPTSNAYQVSKAALNMLDVLEARDYASNGIKVFVTSPGFVRSSLRGPSEEARSGWGEAGDPRTSGELALSFVRGERDGDAGHLVHKDGVYKW